MSLKQKTISGLFWSFIDNFAKLGIQFVVGIILARLLTPREFGLIGMTTIFIAVSQSFINSGFMQALIRKQTVTQADFSTVFYFNLLVSFAFVVLLFFAAGPISQFFSEPELIPIIRVLGLSLLISGLAIVQQAQLTRALNFKLQTEITVIATVLSGATGITMAFTGFGVWSLVIANVSGGLVSVFMLWWWNGWRPSWEFSLDSFREMFSFGSRLLLSGLLDTVYQNIYLVIIGRFFSAADLGYYTRAEGFNRLPSQNITAVVQKVSYPALATLQDDLPRLKAAYRRLLTSVMLITFVLMLGMAAVAEPMVLALIGEQWRTSIGYIQLLAFVGMLYPLHAINLNMLNVQGRSDLFLRLEVIKKILAIPVILTVIFFGIHMMIVAMIVHSAIAYYLNSYWSGKLIGYSPWQQIRDILPSFLPAVGISSLVYLAGILLPVAPIYQLIAQVAIGGLLTIGLAELLRLDSYLYIKEIALDKLLRQAPVA
jgi:teichuronic acid exporter